MTGPGPVEQEVLSLYARYLKRATDIILAGISLVALSPVLLAIAGAILAEDGRPVLFRQTRVGRGEMLFTVLKFRSMPRDAEEVPSVDAAALQVTRTGRIIRRLSFDELPQLFNVLRGDMSLVGPRPPIPAQTSLIALRRKSGAAECLPGLTGLAQVNAYDGMPEDVKADWDAKYAEQVSFWLDIRIIVRTLSYPLQPPPRY